ncbi:MAG: PadR family transcriptional regulator [Oscillospiraceae bacterium]|nr:PadR family transcriptional regulator [Oscillospiraceae bacterium]
MTKQTNHERTSVVLEDNLKKALTEMLVLSLIEEQDRYIGELSPEIEERSQGAIHIEFSYAAIYRISKGEYITECKKRIAPDGRLRQYYTITEKGRAYLSELLGSYSRFIRAADRILSRPDGTNQT